MSDNKIRVMSWNLGSGIYNDKYCKDNKCKTVKQNINGQLKIIKDNVCDIYLFQEVSMLLVNNNFVNQYKLLKSKLTKYNSYFLNNKNIFIEGKVTFTKNDSTSSKIYIPCKSNKLKDDIFVSNKNNIITRIKFNNKELVIFNIHLAPYKRQNELRNKQLSYIIELANREIINDNYVIIGGDFNMNIKDLKFDNLNIALSNKPTSRDLNEPYTKNSKMNCYDGFMHSNNVILKSIDIINNFMYSDHCPIISEFEIKE